MMPKISFFDSRFVSGLKFLLSHRFLLQVSEGRDGYLFHAVDSRHESSSQRHGMITRDDMMGKETVSGGVGGIS